MLLPLLLLVGAARTAAQTTEGGCTCQEACTTANHHREWCKTINACGTYSLWGYYWDNCATTTTPGASTKGGCTCKSSYTWNWKTYDGCTTDDHYASWCAVQSPCCPFFGTVGCWDECGTEGEPYVVLEWPEWGEDDPCEEKLDAWWECMQDECGTTEASEMGDTLGGLLGAWLPGRTKFGKLCGLLCTFLGSCGCQQVLGQIGSEIFGMLGQLVFGGASFLANCGDILEDSAAANAQADSIQGKSCEEIEASNGFASECVNLPYNRDICVAEYRRYIECKYEDQAEQQNLLKDCQLTCPTEIINAAPTPAPRWPTPTPTSSGGGADAASAGGLIAGVVVGVAALAAIAFAVYWYMRAKGGAEPAEPPMVEVEEMASAPVPRKDQLYAAAVPVASPPPIMPPPPPEPAQERPSMLSRLASWRAPAAEAPTGRNLFCTACGAPVQGPFCTQCGARVQ